MRDIRQGVIVNREHIIFYCFQGLGKSKEKRTSDQRTNHRLNNSTLKRINMCFSHSHSFHIETNVRK